MAWHASQLNDRILRLLSPEDRKMLGRAGLTAEEAMRRAEAKNERDLQRLVENLLRLKGIEPIRARMDKATTTRVGTPDFVFAVAGANGGQAAIAWECKMPGKDLEPEQRTMRQALTTGPNGWAYAVIRSVDEALAELRGLGIA